MSVRRTPSDYLVVPEGSPDFVLRRITAPPRSSAIRDRPRRVVFDEVLDREPIDALRAAIGELERARVAPASDREEVVAPKRLCAGRWSMVAQVVCSGRRYVVARREPERQERGPRLTERELQAVELAARGLTNKLVAFEMNISAATVAVFLHRAARKLGVRDRAQLVDAWMALRASGLARPLASSGEPELS